MFITFKTIPAEETDSVKIKIRNFLSSSTPFFAHSCKLEVKLVLEKHGKF
jgi:hypothetical protein